jgi:hypothetical protein
MTTVPTVLRHILVSSVSPLEASAGCSVVMPASCRLTFAVIGNAPFAHPWCQRCEAEAVWL